MRGWNNPVLSLCVGCERLVVMRQGCDQLWVTCRMWHPRWVEGPVIDPESEEFAVLAAANVGTIMKFESCIIMDGCLRMELYRAMWTLRDL